MSGVHYVTLDNQIWTTKHSPYIIQGDTQVEAGHFMLIGPGVEVKFDGYYFMRILGSIMSYGDSGANVAITTNSTQAPGAWKRIEINPSYYGRLNLSSGQYLGGPIFYRTTFSYAGEGAFSLVNGALAFIKSTIQYCQNSYVLQVGGGGFGLGYKITGGGLTAYNSELLIIDSEISNSKQATISGYGIPTCCVCGGGMALVSSSVSCTNSSVINNIDDFNGGGGCQGAVAGGIAVQRGTAVVANSNILNNIHYLGTGAGGLTSRDANLIVINSNIMNNASIDKYVTNSASHGGIYSSGSLLLYNSYVQNNTGCKGGTGGVQMDVGTVIGNDIIDNSGATLSLNFGGISKIYSNKIIHQTASSESMVRKSGGEFLWNRIIGSDVTGEMLILTGAGGIIRNNSFIDGAYEYNVQCSSPASFGNISMEDNYWGVQLTSEMELKGPEGNISKIYDYYDKFDLSKILYVDWAQGAFPLARIDGPNWGKQFKSGQTVSFTGHADDPEDGVISSGSLTWMSDKDGSLGTGSSIDVSSLSVNHHKVWLTATDTDGQEGKVWVEIDVVN